MVRKGRGYGNSRSNQGKCNQKTFSKMFAITLHFDFFKHPVYPYGIMKDLIVGLEMRYKIREIHIKNQNEESRETSRDIQ